MSRRISPQRAAAAAAALLIFAALALLVERGETLEFDLAVRAGVHSWAFPALTAVMRVITTLGSGYFLVPLAALLCARWLMFGNRRAAVLLAAGAGGAEGLSDLLKILFHRPRPEVFFGLAPAETYSFPSGHAFVPAVYFGILAGILAAGPRGRAAVIVLALVLGFSRVYLGYHYPSDVLAGWALAVAWMSLWPLVSAR